MFALPPSQKWNAPAFGEGAVISAGDNSGGILPVERLEP